MGPRRKLRYLINFILLILMSLTIILSAAALHEYIFAPNGNISCHFVDVPYGLDSEELLESIPADGAGIFFHETSCGNVDYIKPRSACAVESAALANPQKMVYLLFSAPITINATKEGVLQKLLQYKNVKIGRIRFNDYIEDTPFEDEWINGGPILNSRYRVSHTSDFLRYLTLWKYGGIYLDLDVVVMKNFDSLGSTSWAARESERAVAAGAMAFDLKEVGRAISEATISELKDNFQTKSWGDNGPGVITRVLKRHCRTELVKDMNAHTCGGFQIFGPELFYPVPYLKWQYYFDPYEVNSVRNFTAAYMHHLWNNFSGEERIRPDSIVPYTYLAEKYCPEVYKLTKDRF